MFIANVFWHVATRHLDEKEPFFFFSFAPCCYIYVTPMRTDVVTEVGHRHLHALVMISLKEDSTSGQHGEDEEKDRP